jgi:quercetin dioxygenase-like cupin family protein
MVWRSAVPRGITMRSGEIIGNVKTGETLTMLISEDECAGARQLYRVRLPPRRPSPPAHYHLKFAETFTVLQGALDIYVGPRGDHIVLHPQESITAEAGQIHTFANHRDVWTVMTVDTRPAGGVVRAFQLAYGLANEGQASQDGLPNNPLARLLFIRTSEGFLPHIPFVVQKTVLALAALLAKVTGVEKRLARTARESSPLLDESRAPMRA